MDLPILGRVSLRAGALCEASRPSRRALVLAPAKNRSSTWLSTKTRLLLKHPVKRHGSSDMVSGPERCQASGSKPIKGFFEAKVHLLTPGPTQPLYWLQLFLSPSHAKRTHQPRVFPDINAKNDCPLTTKNLESAMGDKKPKLTTVLQLEA